jgi:hypothetical protein
MPHRNTDGTFRNNNKTTRISPRSLRARWVETEALALKSLGFTFSRIATQITEIGRGMQRPLTPLPPGVSFPPDYSISSVACYSAVERALKREPRLRAHELRRLLLHRGDQLFLASQPAIQRGELKGILVGIRAVELQASLSGLKSDKITDPPAPAGKKRELPAPGTILSMFECAVNILYDSGAMPRPQGPAPKLIEATPIESDPEDAQPQRDPKKKD